MRESDEGQATLLDEAAAWHQSCIASCPVYSGQCLTCSGISSGARGTWPSMVCVFPAEVCPYAKIVLLNPARQLCTMGLPTAAGAEGQAPDSAL